MQKRGLENDPELTRLLDAEQRAAVRHGSRAQRVELAPPPKPSSDAMKEEREHERGELTFRTEYRRIQGIIRGLNKEFGIGGGNMDTRRGTALNPI